MFIFDQPKIDSLNQIKSIFTRIHDLVYIDYTKQVTTEYDSSRLGVVAASIKDGWPIAYSSKSRTFIQSNLCCIEKEMLSVVFACTRFHKFEYDRKVIVHHDHRPIASCKNHCLYVHQGYNEWDTTLNVIRGCFAGKQLLFLNAVISFQVKNLLFTNSMHKHDTVRFQT